MAKNGKIISFLSTKKYPSRAPLQYQTVSLKKTPSPDNSAGLFSGLRHKSDLLSSSNGRQLKYLPFEIGMVPEAMGLPHQSFDLFLMTLNHSPASMRGCDLHHDSIDRIDILPRWHLVIAVIDPSSMDRKMRFATCIDGEEGYSYHQLPPAEAAVDEGILSASSKTALRFNRQGCRLANAAAGL